MAVGFIGFELAHINIQRNTRPKGGNMRAIHQPHLAFWVLEQNRVDGWHGLVGMTYQKILNLTDDMSKSIPDFLVKQVA